MKPSKKYTILKTTELETNDINHNKSINEFIQIKGIVIIKYYLKKIFNFNNIYIIINKIGKYNYFHYFIVIFLRFLLVIIFLNILLYSIYNYNFNYLNICICAIGKNENLYIKEFINHYKKLRYNHIFLYDNNDINDERFEDVIQKDIKEGFISIINYRGFRGKEKNPQFDAYKDCYKKNNKYYHWLSFFDIDEYLAFNNSNLKAQQFFNQTKFLNCQVIKLNWLFYINNNSLYYENKPLKKRMKNPLFNTKENRHIKSTVRGNLSKNYWLRMNNPHTSLNNYNTCSSSGKIINSSSPFNYPPEYEYAYLKHYQIKSFEEYCLKIRRGRPVPFYKKYKKEKIDDLINNSKNNTKKLEIIKKIFNITLKTSIYQ